MAAVTSLTKLFHAIGTNDHVRAQAIAAEIADGEEKKGHHTAARVLKGALYPNEIRSDSDSNQKNGVLNQSRMISEALSPLETSVSLDKVVLRKELGNELHSVVREWQLRERLAEKKISRRKRFFFYGPPGCGKSLTAGALGRELNLPTFVVRFDAVVGAYLGQTALHLRELFRFAETQPCVLLIDEVDALAKKRGNPLDVGELDRIVISMMQELEHTDPAGFVIATSNLPHHIDEALWRRFDLVVPFPAPSKLEILRFARTIARESGHQLSFSILGKVLKMGSFADVKKLVESDIRRSIIQEFDS